MGRKSLLLVIALFFVLSFSFSSAEDFGYNLIKPDSFNNNTAFVNSSGNWITASLGVLSDASPTQFNNIGGVLTIDTSWLASFGNTIWCQLTGCTMSGDINMDGNDILDAGIINATYLHGDGSNLTGVADADNDFHTYINGSAYDNVHYNITKGDADEVEFVITPGKKFIFGDTYT